MHIRLFARFLSALRLAAPLVALLAASPAGAVSIAFTFGGEVTAVGSAVASAFNVGDPVSITYTFESTTGDSALHPNLGTYYAVTGLSFSFGSYSGGLDTGTSLLVVRNEDIVGGDAYQFFIDAAGPNVNGRVLVDLTVGLYDSTDTVFSSDALPLTLDLSDFDLEVANLYFSGADNNVTFDITSFSSVVPEPGSFALISMGVMGIAAVRRRQR